MPPLAAPLARPASKRLRHNKSASLTMSTLVTLPQLTGTISTALNSSPSSLISTQSKEYIISTKSMRIPLTMISWLTISTQKKNDWKRERRGANQLQLKRRKRAKLSTRNNPKTKRIQKIRQVIARAGRRKSRKRLSNNKNKANNTQQSSKFTLLSSKRNTKNWYKNTIILLPKL